MSHQDGNLSSTERAVSAMIGLSLAAIAGQRGNVLFRTLSAVVGGALLARSYAGYCGVKAAVVGNGSLKEGMSDQWDRMRLGSSPRGTMSDSAPGASSSAGIDAAGNDSFPASDPPASHLPDEPPVNAQAKWDAAKAGPTG
jgi:hypothetical protein